MVGMEHVGGHEVVIAMQRGGMHEDGGSEGVVGVVGGWGGVEGRWVWSKHGVCRGWG